MVIFGVNVGEYSSTMEHLGMENSWIFTKQIMGLAPLMTHGAPPAHVHVLHGTTDAGHLEVHGVVPLLTSTIFKKHRPFIDLVLRMICVYMYIKYMYVYIYIYKNVHIYQHLEKISIMIHDLSRFTMI